MRRIALTLAIDMGNTLKLEAYIQREFADLFENNSFQLVCYAGRYL